MAGSENDGNRLTDTHLSLSGADHTNVIPYLRRTLRSKTTQSVQSASLKVGS